MQRDFNSFMKPIPTTQQGWICPKCGASNSPLVQQCPSCVGTPRLPAGPMFVPPNWLTPGATYGQPELLNEHIDKSSY